MYLYCTKEDKEKHKDCNSKLFNNITEKIYLSFNRYNYSDIYNELVLALLNMASKYKITSEGDKYHKENGTFHMYVSKCFHFEAKRFLDKLIEDPVINHTVPLLNDRDDLDTDCKTEQHVITDDKAEYDFNKMIDNASRDIMIRDSNKLVFKEQGKIEYNDIESLNFNWTNGITCSEIFKDLTSLEREIIVLVYIKRMTVRKISEIYNMNKSDINKIKNSAIEKLKASLNK
jgi:RNA polymerase sigma factor (sigma-70 family)